MTNSVPSASKGRAILCLLLLAVFSGCAAFSSGAESGKARVAATEPLPILAHWGSSVVPLNGGNVIVAGYSQKMDSILIFRCDDSLHFMWTRSIPENMMDKMKSYNDKEGSEYLVNGDAPNWYNFCTIDQNLVVPISTTKDSVTTYHALLLNLQSGASVKDIPLGSLSVGDIAPSSLGGSNESMYLEEQREYYLRFSHDRTHALLCKYRLTGQTATFAATLFDRDLTPSPAITWTLPIDTTKEIFGGVVPDNAGNIFMLIRSKKDQPNSFRIIRHTSDGKNDELAVHPTFGEDTTIRDVRFGLLTDTKAYCACDVRRSDDIEGAGLAIFDFGSHTTNFRWQRVKEISDGVQRLPFLSLTDNLIVLSFEREWEFTSSERWQSETIVSHGTARGDVVLAGFSFDGVPKWSNFFEKDQDWCPGYTMMSESNDALGYWFRDRSVMQRRVFSIKDGKELTDEADHAMLHLGGTHNSIPYSSTELNDGTFLLYSELGMTYSRDVCIYKIVE